MGKQTQKQEVQIKLNTVTDVNELCALANANIGDVLLTSGKFVINAKSFQGIISLDLSQPVTLIAEAPVSDEFITGVQKFIVQTDPYNR